MRLRGVENIFRDGGSDLFMRGVFKNARLYFTYSLSDANKNLFEVGVIYEKNFIKEIPKLNLSKK